MDSVKLGNRNNIKLQTEAKQKSNTNLASNPNSLEKSPKQDEVQINFKNKKGNINKVLIAIGAAGIGVATVVGVLKGKANKAKLLNSIPDDLKTIFSEIKDKNGDEFIDEAYKQMVKYMGLQEIAPSKINRTGIDGVMTITGGFNPVQNTIGYSDGFFKKVDKRKQLNMISHELRHCKQTTDFLRTEGIGIDEYAKVWTENCVQNQLKDPIFKTLTYDPAVKAGKGEELLEQLRKNTYKEFKQEFKKNYSEVFKLPQISANSDEGKRIHKLFEGCKNYEGLGMFGLGSEGYRNNPIELDAYELGDKIEKLFSDFIIATSK